MSDWLFDLGNSRIKFAPLRDGRVGPIQAIAHCADALDAAALATLPSGDRAWVATVASPALSASVMDGLRSRFTHVHLARTLAECAGLRIAYAQPRKLGVDRFLALLALAGSGQPAVIAGVGTALTIDLLDAQGVHRGGRISASPTLMREALHARAAQLPVAGGSYEEFAMDTEDALASGCDGAAIALIERSLQQATALLGALPGLVVHGGGVASLLPELPAAEHRPALVLEGLARWALHTVATDR